MEIYENINKEKAIGCYPKFGLVFLRSQIRIYDDAFKNGGTTFKKGYTVFYVDQESLSSTFFHV